MKREIKIIARSAKGDGMLPMRQGGKIEESKSMEQKNEELCNFIKNAFVADGDVILLQSEKPMQFKQYFFVEDSQRGSFIVAMKPLPTN